MVSYGLWFARPAGNSDEVEHRLASRNYSANKSRRRMRAGKARSLGQVVLPMSEKLTKGIQFSQIPVVIRALAG